MSKGSVNKVILIGRLGADPEVRRTPSDLAIANVSLATNERRRDRNTGDWVEHTEWHRIVFFDKLAEIVGQYPKKGARIYVEGRLQTRKWQDQNGQDRYMTEIIGNDMQMLDSRTGGTVAYDAPGAPQSMPQPSGPGPFDEAPGGSGGNAPRRDFDDDIPF